MTPAERALADALSWWASVEIILRTRGRGITFQLGYEPAWVTEAKAALQGARDPKH